MAGKPRRKVRATGPTRGQLANETRPYGLAPALIFAQRAFAASDIFFRADALIFLFICTAHLIGPGAGIKRRLLNSSPSFSICSLIAASCLNFAAGRFKSFLIICNGVQACSVYGEPATWSTELLPPNGLGAVCLDSGSGIHWPSTTRQYS